MSEEDQIKERAAMMTAKCNASDARYALYYITSGSCCDVHGWKCPTEHECCAKLLGYIKDEETRTAVENMVKNVLLEEVIGKKCQK